ncbi:MAG: hypothetical protein RBR71_02000 [Gudongella sp.]|nr:hypothetical protein [Gudongella sp.]
MSYLIQPLDKCKLTLKNRLVMPPMATEKFEGDEKAIKSMK